MEFEILKKRNFTKKEKERIRLYIEAGLAVFLVAALAFAGGADAFTEQGEAQGNAVSESGTEGSEEADSGTGKNAESESPGGVESGGDDTVENAGTDTSDGAALTEENEGQYPIMGDSDITVQEMVDYFNDSGETYPAEELSEGGADSIETFCQIYYDEASAEGVRPEVAFAQTMKETGFLQYGGDASIEQFNFAGLGTTGGGVPGNSYPDVRTGVRAQIQHLKAYATTDALEQECVDDRYEYVKKGAAPYVEWLGQQENPEGLGWATGENYGYDIVEMIRDMQEE